MNVGCGFRTCSYWVLLLFHYDYDIYTMKNLCFVDLLMSGLATNNNINK